MAVSKRLRFEILKRDNHTCRYCRSQENELTIDHVIPVALGGQDIPGNLVAACKDCNSGKTSSTPDDHLVAEVADAALLQARRFQEALKAQSRVIGDRQQAADFFPDMWDTAAARYGQSFAEPEADWEQSVIRWVGLGIDANIFEDAIEIAMSSPGVTQRNRYRYFCGVMNRKIKKAFEASVAPASEEVKCGHCMSCLDSEPCEIWGIELDEDEEPYNCDVCGSARCMYPLGIDAGMAFESQTQFYRQQEKEKQSGS